MQLYISKNLVLQLRAPICTNCGLYSPQMKTYGSQLQNGIFQEP